MIPHFSRIGGVLNFVKVDEVVSYQKNSNFRRQIRCVYKKVFFVSKSFIVAEMKIIGGLTNS